MPTGTMKIKLGRPDGMPQKRFLLLLEEVRRMCCQARNTSFMHWLIWRHMHPDWQPGAPYEAPPRKIKRTEKPTREDGKVPTDPPYAPREFLSRELYAVASAKVPHLNTSVVSSCVQNVVDTLKANMPYNHPGAARWKWQAILTAEDGPPAFLRGNIPLPRSVSKLTYTEDRCTLRIPLLSKKSGYRVLSPTVHLLVSDLSRGNRRLLRKMAAGEIRLADSQIGTDGKHWYALLTYESPVRAAQVDPERVLEIRPALPDDPRPFVATWMTEDGRQKRWDLGNGKPLIAEYRRVQARRRAIRYRYQDGRGSGHGRQRWYQAIKPMSRYVQDMSTRFQKQLVADSIALAVREDCGTIVFRDPTQPVKDTGWFAKHDVPFNWTSLVSLVRDKKARKLVPAGRLAYRCEITGIALRVEGIRMAEWRPADIEKTGT